MPTSAAETYLSAIAPDVELPPCEKGFQHTVRVCMGTKNRHEIGRRYVWCHGGNRECTVKGPVLSVAEQDILRQKVNEFKANLKVDKQEVLAVGSSGRRIAPKRKRSAQSLPEGTSDEKPANDNEASPIGTVKVHMYFGDNAAESHDGVVVNSVYSFREDERFCEWSSWPEARWLMFDIVQKIWVDIPTFARIEVGSGPLITRQNDPDADLSTYEGLNALIEKELDTYMFTIANSRTSARALPTPSSSQTIPETPSPVASSSKSRKRARKC